MTILKTVLTMSFYGSLMGLVALGVSLLLNKVRAPRAVALVLWALVALRLVCPVELTSRFSVMNAVPRTPAVSHVQTTPVSKVHTPPAQNTPISQGTQTANGAAPQTPASTPVPVESPVSLEAILGVVWAAGVCGFVLWGVVSYVLLRRRLRFAMRLEPDVYEVDTISTPCVAGFRKPRVYLPVGLTPEQQLYTVTHERGHIRHGDHLWKLLSYLVLSLHWFNPLVWVFYFRFQQDMEMACDQRVLKILGPDIRADYSQSLLALAKKQRAVVPSPIAFSENTTKARITGILRYKKPLAVVTALVLAAGIVLAGCMAAGPVEVTDETTQPTEPAETAQPTASGNDPMDTTVLREPPYDALTIDGLVAIHQQEYYRYTQHGSPDQVECFLATPELLLDSDDARDCNREMWEAAAPVLEQAAKAAETHGVFTNCETNYDAWVYENTLTVCMWISRDCEDIDYFVYTFDLDTGRRLTNEEAARVAGLGEDWFNTLHSAVQARFEQRAGLIARDEFYYGELDKTLSQENLSQAVIYPSADGTPMAMYRIYNLAGSASSYELLDLYGALRGHEVDITATLEELFGKKNAVTMELSHCENGWFSNGKAIEVTDPACIREWIYQLSQYTWVAGGADYTACSFIRISVPDSWESITFYDLGDGVLYLYGLSEGGVLVPRSDGEAHNVFDTLREYYDNAELSEVYNICFSAEDAQEAAGYFAETVYRDHLLGLTRGSGYAITDYRVVQWDTINTGDDGNAIVIHLEYATVPADWNSPLIWTGNTRTGTGEWEGWAIATREIGLQKTDSSWHCYSMGTGGVQLP